MAVLTAYQSLDLLDPAFALGGPGGVVATSDPGLIVLDEADGARASLFGTFRLDSAGAVAGGSVDAVEEADRLRFLVYRLDDAHADAPTVSALGLAGGFPLVAYLLRGDDTLFGSAASDTLVGGDGHDHVHGGGGDDVVNGNAGLDLVYGEAGDDTVHGGQGDDIIFGDVFDGAQAGGDDVLYGDRGDDLITGEAGNDTLSGGEGHDAFFFDSFSDRDVILDFSLDDDAILIEENVNQSGLTSDLPFEALLARIADDGEGNSLLDLGGDNTVLILGVRPDAFRPEHFEFFPPEVF